LRPRISYDSRLRISALFEEDADKYLNTEVTLCGWASNVRIAEKGALCFVELYDGSTFKKVQVVAKEGVTNFDKLIETGVGSSYKLTGTLIESPAQG